MNMLHKTLLATLTSLSLSHAYASESAIVEPKTQSFLNALAQSGGPALETLSPTEARKVLQGAQANAVLPPAKVNEKTIQVNGQDLKLFIVRPEHAKAELPVFMFIHGGGWILGDFPTHERLVRDLVNASGAAAVFVDYTPSPEARYPVAIEQIYAATQWIAANGKSLKLDGSRIAIVGNSVGGNMATAVSLMAKDRAGPKIASQVLLWPVTNANFENASYDQFEQGYFLTRPMMKWFWNAYTTNPAERQQIYASPLLASAEQLQGLPPTLIISAENDVLRDEGEAYGRKLSNAGVPTVVTRYNGMIHDFGLLNTLSDLPATKAAIQQAGTEIKTQLAKK